MVKPWTMYTSECQAKICIFISLWIWRSLDWTIFAIHAGVGPPAYAQSERAYDTREESESPGQSVRDYFFFIFFFSESRFSLS